MNLRDDPRYFPQPDVPNNGNYGGSFGREQLYYDYLPKSAAIEAAGEKTYSSGKYAFNPATGQYTWVPAGTVASNLGDSAGAGAGINAGMQGGEGGAGDYGGQKSTPNYGPAATLGAYLSDKGLTSIGGYLSQAAREGRTAQQETPTDEQDSSRDNTQGPSQAAAAAASNDSSGGGGGYGSGGNGAGPGGSGGNDGGYGPQANGGMVGHYAQGGLGSLGNYSDGGRLLRGPGDGVSDSIPATIGKAKRPARLADGEFVVPARIVSELGNGSTEAGARKLYAMLARIQAGRKKSIGRGKVAANSRMDKHLPA
jgi:hypothetical protein